MEIENYSLSMKSDAYRIKLARVLMGDLSVGDVARSTGIPEATIYAYEAQKRKVGIDYIKSLYDAFKISPLWVISGVGEVFLHDKEPDTDNGAARDEIVANLREQMKLLLESDVLLRNENALLEKRASKSNISFDEIVAAFKALCKEEKERCKLLI